MTDHVDDRRFDITTSGGACGIDLGHRRSASLGDLGVGGGETFDAFGLERCSGGLDTLLGLGTQRCDARLVAGDVGTQAAVAASAASRS